MKLVYFSSVLNHHQRALCDAFYEILGNDFMFVETMPMERQRVELGYQEEEASYVLKSYLSEENRQKAIKIAIECDVFLGAVFPIEILHERMKHNRLTFRHMETYFKRSKLRMFTPNALKIAYNEHFKYRNKSLYLLCASSRVANDVKLFGAYPNKKFKWGYFPVVEYEKKSCSQKKNRRIEIVWVGRMISWKKPEYAIEAVKYLKNKNYNVHLNMIGIGRLLPEIQNKIKKFQLEDEVTLCGSMSPKQVRKYMLKSNIFLFTSTRQEGWGAVLNEAMSAHCAIVASAEAGSTGYLIKEEINGLVYRHNSCIELKRLAERLCSNVENCEIMGENAYNEVKNLWNHNVAAKRFLEVTQALLANKEVPIYKEGPMSKG